MPKSLAIGPNPDTSLPVNQETQHRYIFQVMYECICRWIISVQSRRGSDPYVPCRIFGDRVNLPRP
jgi:hypothetical protein